MHPGRQAAAVFPARLEARVWIPNFEADHPERRLGEVAYHGFRGSAGNPGWIQAAPDTLCGLQGEWYIENHTTERILDPGGVSVLCTLLCTLYISAGQEERCSQCTSVSA